MILKSQKKKKLYKEIKQKFEQPFNLSDHLKLMKPSLRAKYLNVVKNKDNFFDIHSIVGNFDISDYGYRELLFIENLNKSMRINLFVNDYCTIIFQNGIEFPKILRKQMIKKIEECRKIFFKMEKDKIWKLKSDNRAKITFFNFQNKSINDLIEIMRAIVEEICILTYMEKSDLKLRDKMIQRHSLDKHKKNKEEDIFDKSFNLGKKYSAELNDCFSFTTIANSFKLIFSNLCHLIQSAAMIVETYLKNQRDEIKYEETFFLSVCYGHDLKSKYYNKLYNLKLESNMILKREMFFEIVDDINNTKLYTY